ncbi:MAG: hypothetical protein D6784_08590 [Chloroflexi bacterium]|nr:MAG: hypothetical protein D6784_08590 [Chloroflexota bacterium]
MNINSHRHWIPFAGYIAVAVVTTWPLATHLWGWVPGVGDWGQNMWALWWTRLSLLSLGQSPFFTRYLFYPEGVTLLFHPVDVADGLLAIPLWGVLGSDASYNVMILLSFVLGGWGAYLLALDLTGCRWASFVAGLVFALSPYHFLRLQIGHLNLSTVQWIPFYSLFLLRFVRRGDWRSAGLAVFFLTWMALHSWYYVVYCGMLSLVVLLWPLPPVRRAVSAGRVGLVLGGAVVILSPLLLPMFQLLGETTLVGEHDPLRHSVDVYSFFVPGPTSSWAEWFEDVWISYAAHNREPGASAYPGYVALVLALSGVVHQQWRRAVTWWWAVALLFTGLALGPQLQIDGQILPVSLPYRWLTQAIPIFAITGIPGRMVVITSLALAMLTAYGLTGWLAKLNRSNIRWRMGVAVVLLVGLEYSAVPIQLTSTQTDEFYTRMGQDQELYAVVDIKWDVNFLMHKQTIHGKPLIGGWLARLPADKAAYLNQGGVDKTLLAFLVGLEWRQYTDPAALKAAVQAALSARQVRYIIDHDNVAGAWIAELTGWPVVYESEGMVVYQNPIEEAWISR